MEALNLIRLFWGWVFFYISRIHTAYIGEDSSILGINEMFGDRKTFTILKWAQYYMTISTISVVVSMDAHNFPTSPY